MRMLVTSRYAARDAWEPFQRMLRHHAPGFPWPVELVTDRRAGTLWTFGAVHEIGKDLGYSKNLLRALEGVPDEVIFLIMEDMIPDGPWDLAYVERWVGKMEKDSSLGMVRLYPCPGGDEPWGDPALRMGRIRKETAYRVSCMAALWKKSVLRFLLERTRSAWEFELSGTPLTRELPEEFLAYLREREPWPVHHMATGITRGKWEPNALAYLAKMGVTVGERLDHERPYP